MVEVGDGQQCALAIRSPEGLGLIECLELLDTEHLPNMEIWEGPHRHQAAFGRERLAPW
jgi:hypothetical protein